MKIRYCHRCQQDIENDAPTKYKYMSMKTLWFCSNGCLILHLIEGTFSHGHEVEVIK